MVDRTFIDELASAAPAPGGGGASAYCGALASALASMVGELTLGKKRYADVEDEVRAQLAALAAVRERLLHLIDEDAAAFEPLAATYRMPQDTAEEARARNDALQEALVGACEVPLAIMEACKEVIDRCAFMAAHGSRLALSDAGVAAAFAKAALQGASFNILINVKSMDDAAAAASYRNKMNDLLDVGGHQADAILSQVCKELA